jgi:hypothetical protein
MPMDILVIRHSDLSELKEVPGLIYASILKGGKVVYEKAA